MINPEELRNERLGEAIMRVVLDDITDRRGLRQEWERFDKEIQNEIEDTLWMKIGIVLKAPEQTSLEELRTMARRAGYPR